MNINKILLICCITLAISNVLLLLNQNRPEFNKPNPARNRDIIIKQLHFDPEQVNRYDSLIDIHRSTNHQLIDQIITEKKDLYRQLNEAVDTAVINNAYYEIAKLQRSLELNHFEHFMAIKKICKPNQMQDYENLTKDLAKLFTPGQPPRMK